MTTLSLKTVATFMYVPFPFVDAKIQTGHALRYGGSSECLIDISVSMIV
jgi:hypothetical protein